ncbi:MAG: FimV/HubP family polar landmark protein, partial [Pseudomonadota bacterium]
MKRIANLCTALFVALSLLVSIANAQSQIQGPRASADAYSGVVYGPIDSSDTLWRIASRYKQDGKFTVYQTMLAIYQLNPRSFENNNFNTMVNGAMLRLPSDSYISRIDPQRALAKANADERSFAALGGNVQEPAPTQGSPQADSPDLVAIDENLKDAPPLVNQEDLSNTQKELQDQLNELNRQQNRLFAALKDQVSASIDNVQDLIEENKKSYELLEQRNKEVDELRAELEAELQSQNEELASQRELLEAIKADQEKQAQAAENDWLNKLTSPTGLIILSTSGTLIIIGLVAYLLLRRKPEAESAPVAQDAAIVKESSDSEDIIDDELVIGEAIDDIDEDTDELLKALSDDVEEDDILSDQLEDGLDEIPVDDNVDDFTSLEDEMLVPDSPSDDTSDAEQANDESNSDKVNFDADAITLDDDEFDNQSIDLSAETTLDNDAESQAAPAPENSTATPEASEVNDIAADTNAGVSDVPEGIQLNEDGEVDDSTIEMIEQKIQEKDAEITQLTNEILEELEITIDESDESEGEDADNAEDTDNIEGLELSAESDEILNAEDALEL